MSNREIQLDAAALCRWTHRMQLREHDWEALDDAPHRVKSVLGAFQLNRADAESVLREMTNGAVTRRNRQILKDLLVAMDDGINLADDILLEWHNAQEDAGTLSDGMESRWMHWMSVIDWLQDDMPEAFSQAAETGLIPLTLSEWWEIRNPWLRLQDWIDDLREGFAS